MRTGADPSEVAPLVDPDVVERVLAEALRHGGDFAELFAERRGGVGASLDDGRVEEVATGLERGAGVRVVVGETTGYAHCADLSEPALLEAARTASAVARSRTEGAHVVGLEGGTAQASGAGSRGQATDALGAGPRAWGFGPSSTGVDPETVPKDRKVALLHLADEVARSEGAAVRQVTASYGDARRTVLVASSDGRFATAEWLRTRLSVSCVAAGDTGLTTGYDTLAGTRGFELMDEAEVIRVAREAARRALVKLEAVPAPSGPVPVVLAAGSGGILFHEACGHGLEADHVAKHASVYAGRLGQRVASPLVTLVDDGTLAGEWGWLPVDDEGSPGRRSVLIEEGVLVDYMWDRLKALKQGRASWANGRRESYRHLPMVRMTNTFVLPGRDDPEAILEDTAAGVYVVKLGGGQVNTATGDFVFGTTEAYMIEHGRLGPPLRDANLIGNGPEILAAVEAVGSDFGMTPGTCGKDGQSVPVGCGQPTLRVRAVTIGGTAAG